MRCSMCRKNAYSDVESARFAAAIQWKHDGISLRIYPCPHGFGHHLTKMQLRKVA